jgi:Condensation domain
LADPDLQRAAGREHDTTYIRKASEMSEQSQRSGPLQSGICQMEWLSYQSGGRGMFLNLYGVATVPSGLSDHQVADSIIALLIRHEALRTTLDADAAGRPRQCVHDATLPPLPRLTDERSYQQYVDAPFDVGSELPIRFARTGTGDVLFAVAHIVADWAGLSVLAADLREILEACGQRRVARLSDGAPQPIDRALAERHGRGRARAESSLQHWDAALRKFPATVFPVSRGTLGADMVIVEFDSDALGPGLSSLCQTFGGSPASVFMTAVYLALAVQFRRRVVGLNVTWSARVSPRDREMVASIFRDMPLLVDLHGLPSFSEVLRRIRDALFVSSRHMYFDVLEFHECAGRVEVEMGRFLHSPEVVNCMLDDFSCEPLEPGVDLLNLLDTSHATTSRTNDPPMGVCNLFVGVLPMNGKTRIRLFVDESLLDEQGGVAFVELVEAIVIHAAVHRDLTFSAAELLAVNAWRPDGPHWANVDGVWVDLDFISSVLRDHPAVHDADVRVEDGKITAHVAADMEPWELRSHVLSRGNGRNATVSPHHFVVRRSDAATVTGTGLRRPILLPRQRAEQALRDAIVEANGLKESELSMADTYISAGGRLHLIPRVLSLLVGEGFQGLTVADLRRPASLFVLAEQMRRTAS